jgi:hypothetical protein
MIELLLKLICGIALVVVGIVVFVHLLPFLIAILVVLGLFKLYHYLRRPKVGPPTRWPWRDP